MKLLAASPSPYVRKVRMTAKLKGLDAQVEVIGDDHPEIKALRASNPLGKIPVLLADDGNIIYDSHVICEYLDSQVASPVLFPGDGAARWQTLTRAALGDGILDSALLIVYEARYRPENMRVGSWVEMQQAKIDSAVAALEAEPPNWGAHPDYGHVTIAAALGYLDFRHAGAWRTSAPAMVDWLSRFAAAAPAYNETAPPTA
ncbi:MAG: glutathione S-transferase family protein [Hyphomicrobiaceae bacterium]